MDDDADLGADDATTDWGWMLYAAVFCMCCGPVALGLALWGLLR